MTARVKAGDTVVLNDEGLKSCYGSTIGLGFMKTKKMKVLWVSPDSLTEPEESFEVRVDDSEVNQFMITDIDFNVVR